MEIVSVIENLIGSLGFPIVMVGYFIWDKQTSIKPLVDAVNNNTDVLNNLITLLQSKGKGDIFE